MLNSAFSGSRAATRALQFLCAAGLTLSVTTGCLDDVVEGDDSAYFDRSGPGPGPGPDDSTTVVGEGEWKQRVSAANDCDMTGKWIAQIITVSSALGAEATSYNWYYYDITDNGDEATINRGWDCSFEVCGTSSVFPLPETGEELSLRNRQDGVLDAVANITVAPRRVIYKPAGDGLCYFEMERWWWLRGLDSTSFYPPRDRFADMTHSEMNGLVPMPTKANTAGNEDWDGDGYPGIYLSVTAPAIGHRHVSHRDWNEYGPALIPDGSSNFIVPADFDAQEIVYSANPSLLDQLSQSTHQFNRVRFIRLPDNTEPPEDKAGFRQWCERTVSEHFRDGQCGNQYEEFDRWMYFRQLFNRDITPDPYPYPAP